MGPKNLYFNYWNDLTLDSGETSFLEVGAYVSLKRAKPMADRVVFPEFEWKYHCFWNLKTGEWDLKIFLFHYWNDLALGLVEPYFLKVGGYVSLKQATAVIW